MGKASNVEYSKLHTGSKCTVVGYGSSSVAMVDAMVDAVVDAMVEEPTPSVTNTMVGVGSGTNPYCRSEALFYLCLLYTSPSPRD